MRFNSIVFHKVTEAILASELTSHIDMEVAKTAASFLALEA